VRLHPAVSVSDIIGDVKVYSSYITSNQIYPDSGFHWQGGYSALPFSKKELSRLIHYIEKQKEHHNQQNLNQTCELDGS
jgi:putative transposase